MANMIDPEVMGQMINAKVSALCKITPYAKLDTSLQGVPGDTKTVPSWNYIGDAEDVAEGAEVGLSALTASSATFTIKKAMKAVGITEEARLSGLGDPIGQAETQLSKAIAQKVDNDLIEAAYGSKVTYDGSADVINYGGIVGANGVFEDEEDGIEKVMFIHPNQETQLLNDAMFTSADRFEGGVAVKGSIGKIAGCWVKKSRKVKLEGNNYLNPIIKLQPDDAETEFTEDELPALTIFLKQEIKVDINFLARKQLTEVVAAKYYGVALTNEAKVIIAKFAKAATV